MLWWRRLNILTLFYICTTCVNNAFLIFYHGYYYYYFASGDLDSWIHAYGHVLGGDVHDAHHLNRYHSLYHSH
jgi:hypothetical protein